MKKWYFQILACPNCSADFSQNDELLICNACSFSACLSNADLRPTRPKTVQLKFPRVFDVGHALSSVELARPVLSYKGPVGMRDASELLSVMEQTLNKPGQVLDLGCGPKDQAEPITFLGHKYVGVDVTNPRADILADAHALPFQANSFDFIFSYAVLEHLYNPFLAFQEVGRVLKPGGVFCGTVSQGEPFHNSFFHHTAWGVLSLAHTTELQVLRLWPCWDTLSGLADMGRYPKAVRSGILLLDWIHNRLPFLAPRKMKWPSKERFLDALYRAASVGFIVRKN